MKEQFPLKSTYIVKGVAILLLLNYHLFEDAALVSELSVDYSPFPQDIFLTFSEFGNVSVAVFVFLTAYGITKGILAQGETSLRELYCQATRRMAKLMLNFLAMFASVTLLWAHWFDFVSLYGQGKQGLLSMLADGVGMAQILNTPTLNMTWWYMEIAYVLIFLVPLLCILVQRLGYSLLPVAFFLPVVLQINPDVSRYLFTAAAGVCAVYGKWIERLLNRKLHPILGWMAGGTGLILCVMIRQNYFVQECFLHLADAGIALFLVWFSVALPGSVPVIRDILGFIGRHSMNIYMVHTFFYMILWRKRIYAFHYAGAILAALLLVSLAWSMALEWVKRGISWLIRKRKT